MQLAQSTITELVRRAEAAGLVEREQSTDDLRTVDLRLSTEGEPRLAAAFTSHEEERDPLRPVLHPIDS
jgi:DNA-binding MarR family transcriptional regulator